MPPGDDIEWDRVGGWGSEESHKAQSRQTMWEGSWSQLSKMWFSRFGSWCRLVEQGETSIKREEKNDRFGAYLRQRWRDQRTRVSRPRWRFLGAKNDQVAKSRLHHATFLKIIFVHACLCRNPTIKCIGPSQKQTINGWGRPIPGSVRAYYWQWVEMEWFNLVLTYLLKNK